MAYETGSASDTSDLLDKLRAFLLTNGWTINSFITVGSGKRLHINKSDTYINLRSYINETLSSANDVNGQTTSAFYGIGFSPSTGYDSGQLWSRQPGYANYGSVSKGGYLNQLSSAIPVYHFFTYSDIDEVHIVLEFVSGKIQYLGFGKISKFTAGAVGGNWIGGGTYSNTGLPHSNGIDYTAAAAALLPFREGVYSSSTACCSSFIKVNIDGHDGWACGAKSSNQTPSPIAAVGEDYWDNPTLGGTVNTFGWKTRLLGYMIGIVRSNASISPFGVIKHLRRLDITNYSLGQEETLGSDVWKVFPLYQKGGYSANRGFAVRKT